MKPIHAIYENGVFRPTEPVEVPNGSEVAIEYVYVKKEPETSLYEERLPEGAENHPQYELLKIMSRRYRSGRSDVSERHNEHRP